MKLIVVALIALVAICDGANYEDKWKVAKAKYGLSFKDSKAERDAFNTYAKNMERIEMQNAMGNLGYELGENQFTYLESEELNKKLLMSEQVASELVSSMKSMAAGKTAPQVSATVPASKDFTNLFVDAKSQGGCGSCYTFATTGVIEAQYAIKTGKKISLSEEQLLDCTFPLNSGCNGGSVLKCFNYTMYGSGLVQSSSYPYKGSVSTCSVPSATKVKILRYGWAETQNNEERIKNFLATNGPISIYYKVTPSFYSYKSGIFNDPACPKNTNVIDHAMVLVGYGTEGGKDFWLVRNSWDKTWGINGYAKIARNNNNMCNIASYPFFAFV